MDFNTKIRNLIDMDIGDIYYVLGLVWIAVMVA